MQIFSGRILNFLFIILVLIALFDPADRLIGIKKEVFIGYIILFLANLLICPKQKLSLKGLLFFCAFILIPLLSLSLSSMKCDSPETNISSLHSFFFSLIVLIALSTKMDIVSSLSFCLVPLAFVVLVCFSIVLYAPDLIGLLDTWGNYYGNIRFGRRVYGGIEITQVFSTVSQLFTIGISFFLYKYHLCGKFYVKMGYLFLVCILVLAMFVGATRNNILISIFLPFMILFYFSNRKIFIGLFMISLFFFLFLFFNEEIYAMFDPTNPSNKIKISYLNDYQKIFSDSNTLIWGQGLGHEHYWAILGEKQSTVELTYLEILREFGLILGIFLLTILFLPFVSLLKRNNKLNHVVLMAYGCYLVMSFSNPFLFSSSGILIFGAAFSLSFSSTARNILEK